MEIRIYNDTEDREAVKDLWQRVFGYQDARNEPGFVIDLKLSRQDGLFFIARESQNLLGTIMAGYDGHRGWIYSLGVDPNSRLKGVGTALLRRAEQALSDLGCVKINLQIMDYNGRVQEFYRKNGYAAEPRISMGKEISHNIPSRDFQKEGK
ncbi:GNAT family acetyltransferase [Spirochaeta lutea]|uniref:Acetyltransferase n=1 Tax=Spirochaeta lutea TaxID=1480694 RepID=A0A098R196_9SPIO|nr:GNAT family acetyltransferase [Spirochaeta lutea]KGE73885.1 acetyltransferase [Spirochaeta lutea]